MASTATSTDLLSLMLSVLLHLLQHRHCSISQPKQCFSADNSAGDESTLANATIADADASASANATAAAAADIVSAQCKFLLQESHATETCFTLQHEREHAQ